MPEWPFAPLDPVRETVEWSTEVLSASQAEQRAARRTVPREIVTLRHRLTDAEAAQAEDLARASFSDGWTVPLWSRVDGATPPTRAATLTRAVRVSRERRNLSVVEAEFTLAPEASPPAAPTYPQHQGVDVLTDPTIARRPIQAAYAEVVEYVDNGFGPIAVERVRTAPASTNEIAWKDYGTTARQARRGWLYALRGPQGIFWLPSWMNDLPIQGPAGGTSIQVATTLGAGALVGSSIMIDTDPPQFRTVTGATADGSTATLQFLGALDPDATAATRVHKLRLVRLAGDRVDIAHSAVASEGVAAVQDVPISELPG